MMYHRIVNIIRIIGCFILFKGVKGETKSACFGIEQRTIDISCPVGHMVRINKAFYGHSESNSCYHTLGDCVLSEKENFQCVGHESCSINLPSGRFGRKITTCGKYSNYFQVEYQCHQAVQTQNICENAKFTGQRGFISTPRYPNNYHGPAMCETNIEVNPNQKIDLYIIDMDIQKNGTAGCIDWMYVYDNFRSITLCGQRGNETFTSMRNNIQIKFNSDNSGHQKGFWLYYEAFPPLHEPEQTAEAEVERSTATINDNASLQSRVLRPNKLDKKTESNGDTIPVKHYYHKQNQDDDKDFPFAAIIAGVIGTLVLILAVLLVLLLHMWYKERRRRHTKEQFLEIQNPAYRSSGSEFPNCDYYPTRPQESFYC